MSTYILYEVNLALQLLHLELCTFIKKNKKKKQVKVLIQLYSCTHIENCTSLVLKQGLHQTGRSTNLFKSNNISLILSHDDSPLKCSGR